MSYPFEAHTPYRLFYSGIVESITITLTDGEIGVYTNHSFFSAPVRAGILKIKDEKGQQLEAFVTEGILEVKGHKTVLLVDAAEWPDEIDYERALKAKERAEASIKDKDGSFKFEIETAQAALKRAEFRIKAYSLRRNKAP